MVIRSSTTRITIRRACQRNTAVSNGTSVILRFRWADSRPARCSISHASAWPTISRAKVRRFSAAAGDATTITPASSPLAWMCPPACRHSTWATTSMACHCWREISPPSTLARRRFHRRPWIVRMTGSLSQTATTSRSLSARRGQACWKLLMSATTVMTWPTAAVLVQISIWFPSARCCPARTVALTPTA